MWMVPDDGAPSWGLSRSVGGLELRNACGASGRGRGFCCRDGCLRSDHENFCVGELCCVNASI
jgi:hypothetical protein